MKRVGFQKLRFRPRPHKRTSSPSCEYQSILRLMSKLDTGNLMDILTIEAQDDFSSWIEENNLVDGTAFSIVINFTDECRTKNAALYCSLKMDFNGDLPKVACSSMIPGISNDAPKEMPKIRFEFFLCDLNIV